MKNYLKSIRKEFLKDKLELESELEGMRVKMQENAKVMQHMKHEACDQYDAFSPRVQNQDLYDSILCLERENQELSDESKSKERQVKIWNSKLKEIDLVLRKARIQKEELVHKQQDFTDLKILEARECERQNIAKNLYEIYISILTMVHRGEFCTRLIEMDPVRCKIELLSLLDMLRTAEAGIDALMQDLQPMPEDISLQEMILKDLEKLKEQGMTVDCMTEGEIYHFKPIYRITVYRIVKYLFSMIGQQEISDATLHVSLNYQPGQFHFMLEGSLNKDIDVFPIEDLLRIISGKIEIEKKDPFYYISLEIPDAGEE